MQPKDILLAPIYLYQGSKLKRTALRLPEAKGERQGTIKLFKPTSKHTNKHNTLNLMLVGDSAAAGVGVNTQQESMVGHLLKELQHLPKLNEMYTCIKWSLHATSGHSSYDLLCRLYVLPKPVKAVDITIIVIGANDTTKNVSNAQWLHQLNEITTIAKRKFGAKHILFSCLPPMANFPAIPKPLNSFIGAKAKNLDNRLKDFCNQQSDVFYLDVDFANIELNAKDMFASDGFHPNKITYEYWAKQIAQKLLNII